MVAIEFNGAVHYGTHLGPDGAYMTPRPLGGTLLKERCVHTQGRLCLSIAGGTTNLAI